MKIKTVGVVGSGTMGSGIAQACAVSGIQVLMVDISQDALDKGKKNIANSLERLLSKEKITAKDQTSALTTAIWSLRRPPKILASKSKYWIFSNPT